MDKSDAVEQRYRLGYARPLDYIVRVNVRLDSCVGEEDPGRFVKRNRDWVSTLNHELVHYVQFMATPVGRRIAQLWQFLSAWQLLLLRNVGERLRVPISTWIGRDAALASRPEVARILDQLTQDYQAKEDATSAEVMRHFEKAVMLQTLDSAWKEHLAAMDYLRQGIHLRGYAQKNPKQEYKREAFEMFSSMLDNLKLEVVGLISRVQVQSQQQVEEYGKKRPLSSLPDFHEGNIGCRPLHV